MQIGTNQIESKSCVKCHTPCVFVCEQYFIILYTTLVSHEVNKKAINSPTAAIKNSVAQFQFCDVSGDHIIIFIIKETNMEHINASVKKIGRKNKITF